MENSPQYYVSNSSFLYSVPKVHMMKDLTDEIAFMGRSNAGKSSLLNAICQNKNLAKTSKTPGRTRHAVVYSVDINGPDNKKALTFVDLPGFGFAALSKKEARDITTLIHEYLERRAQLRIICLLLDLRRNPDDREINIINLAKKNNKKIFVILTKCDKLAASKQKPAKKQVMNKLNLSEGQIFLHSINKPELTRELTKSLYNSFH